MYYICIIFMEIYIYAKINVLNITCISMFIIKTGGGGDIQGGNILGGGDVRGEMP